MRIWLAHYESTGRAGSNAYFLLFTTAVIATGSFLEQFADTDADGDARAKDASHALAASRSKEIAKVKADLADLSAEEACDFYARIFPDTPRIDEIPELINRRLITVRRQSRQSLFERLEEWWLNQIIEFLTGQRTKLIRVQEVTDIRAPHRQDRVGGRRRNAISARGSDPAATAPARRACDG